MPLVKVIGPTPDTATAAAAIPEIELRKYSNEDPQPGTSTSPTQQQQEEQESRPSSDIQIHFWRKRPQQNEDNDDVPEEVRAVRSIHASFILTLHAHAIGYLLFALTQWILLYYMIEALAVFVKEYYYLALIPFVLGFVMLMCLVFFYNYLIKTRKAMFYLYNAILDFYLHAPHYIIAWTFRCFIVSSVGIITAISVQSPYFVAIMTMIMTFFMLLFILICGKTLSRSEFIWLDKYGPHLYGSLFYLNYITIFCMCVLLFEQLEEAQMLS